jgi:hypothetical protein
METRSILVDTLPEHITVHGEKYKVHSDFRTCLKIIMAFEDPELTPQEKQMVLLGNLYKKIPADISEALRQANIFLNGGEVQEGTEAPTHRLYSFSKDARFIYAAFRQTHGLDLAEEKLHWWKFLALFMDLGAETTFSQLIGLRKRIKTGKASKEERSAAREMGEAFDVPDIDSRTLEEKQAESEFMRLVRNRK